MPEQVSAPGTVLLFGDVNIDNLLFIPEYPVPGRDGLATQAETHLGGAVCNSAVDLTQLGQPAALLAATGTDPWADLAFSELARAGVDTTRLVRKAGMTTGLIFIAITPNGERTMFCNRAANSFITPQDCSANVLDGVNLIQVSGYAFLNSPQRDTAWHLMELARQKGIPISLDSGLDPVILQTEDLRRSLEFLSLCVVGDQEASLLTSETELHAATQALRAAGPEIVAVKLGREGCLIAWDTEQLVLPPFPVQVLDTTGAGDAFSAGLIYGWLHGFSPAAAGVLANAMGGLTTTVTGGAQIGLVELLLFLRQQKDYPAQAALAEVLQHFSG
ncbi:MAG: carbohydrate kinase family protein [Chloroflexi bacterium]|nr:carbohydrate kinase family protein [Chloroflexota bacterium]